MPFKVPETEFPLGSSVRDPISRIEGIVDGKVYWFNGLIRSTILPYGQLPDGKPKTSFTLDEHLLVKHDGATVTTKIDRKDPIFDIGERVEDKFTPSFFGTIILVHLTLNGCIYYGVQCPYLNPENNSVIINEVNEMQLRPVATGDSRFLEMDSAGSKDIRSSPPNLKTPGSKLGPARALR